MSSAYHLEVASRTESEASGKTTTITTTVVTPMPPSPPPAPAVPADVNAGEEGTDAVPPSSAAGYEYVSNCILPTEFIKLKLIRKANYNHNAGLFTFEVPGNQLLNLPTCACILVRGGKDKEGSPVVRPYTPVFTNTPGEFTLLIKVYPDGVLSSWMDGLSIGKEAEFKLIKQNLKARHPFGKKRVSMIAGGTGITPMYQALEQIVNTGDDTEVVLLYGNATVADILLKAELDDLASKSGGKVKVVHVVGSKPDQEPIEGWDGELGWVDEAKVKKFLFPPAPDSLVFVCGLPGLYKAMCGARTEPELQEGTILQRLGYTAENVKKF